MGSVPRTAGVEALALDSRSARWTSCPTLGRDARRVISLQHSVPRGVSVGFGDDLGQIIPQNRAAASKTHPICP